MKVLNRSPKKTSHLKLVSATGIDGYLINQNRVDGLKKSLEYLEIEIEQIRVDFHLGALTINREGQILVLLQYLEHVIDEIKNLFISTEQLDFISANILMDEIDERLNKVIHHILIIKDFLIPQEESVC